MHTCIHTHTHTPLHSLKMSGTGHIVEKHCAFTISKSWDKMN